MSGYEVYMDGGNHVQQVRGAHGRQSCVGGLGGGHLVVGLPCQVLIAFLLVKVPNRDGISAGSKSNILVDSLFYQIIS